MIPIIVLLLWIIDIGGNMFFFWAWLFLFIVSMVIFCLLFCLLNITFLIRSSFLFTMISLHPSSIHTLLFQKEICEVRLKIYALPTISRSANF